MQSEDHRRTALQYPLLHWTLCRCQQYGAFSMKDLARYQIILLGEQRHIRCEQLAQGCCPNNAAVGVEPLAWSRVRRPTATPPSRRTYLLTYLILVKKILIVATKCQILTLKCTKFNFGWGAAPGHAGKFTAIAWLLTDGRERDWLPLITELTMSRSSEMRILIRLLCTSKCTFVRSSAEFVFTALPTTSWV